MRVVMVQDDSLLRWMESKIEGEGEIPNPFASFGIVDSDGRRCGGLIYHNYRGQNIEETFVAENPRCLTKRVISQLLAWPFEVLGCKRITGLIAETNHRSIRLTEGLGFVLEGRLRDAGDDGDLLLYGLTKTDFYGGRFGQKSTEST